MCTVGLCTRRGTWLPHHSPSAAPVGQRCVCGLSIVASAPVVATVGPYSPAAVVLAEQYIPTSRPLVDTAGTIANLSKAMDAVHAQTPVLFEGATGAGKSATVTELARRLMRPLIRFNMSSKVAISTLLGGTWPALAQAVLHGNPDSPPLPPSARDVPSRNPAWVSEGWSCGGAGVTVKTAGGQLKPEFALGPFTIAFQHGFWLLLDELNLASGEVLASLENALDTGRLTVADDTNSTVREQVGWWWRACGARAARVVLVFGAG